MTSLRLANRSYAIAENPKVTDIFPVANDTKISTQNLPVAKVLERQLMSEHIITVYGALPAFQTIVVADC